MLHFTIQELYQVLRWVFAAGVQHFLVVVNNALISDANVYSKIKSIIASAYNTRKFVYTQYGAELSFNEILINFPGTSGQMLLILLSTCNYD